MSDDLKEGTRRNNEIHGVVGTGADGEPPVDGTGSGSPAEVGGRPGPDPTRYGDWEKAGRCIDF
jgi:shikimate dehydrogenase